MKKTIAALAATFAVLLGAGCATDAPSSTSSESAADNSAAQHNDADIEFAQSMIPHHMQAVHMSQMAATRAGSDEVKALAKQIEAAQLPEISDLKSLLAEWGADVPADMSGGGHGGHMDHGSMHGDMEGMLTTEELDSLDNAQGTEFDKLYLEYMIKHHEGAVTMTEKVIADGRNDELVAMAEKMQEDQTAEIEQMQKMLDALG